ncbi:MAG: T9SS type A sorting domain-containing protein [Chitinophagales bacterium]
MPRNTYRALIAGLFVCLFRPAFCQTDSLPFSISLVEETHASWPGMHSFSMGADAGQWILIGGRIGGIHTLLPPDPFPVSEANDSIFLFDPLSDAYYTSGLSTLPEILQGQLRSTNAEYVQRDGHLYIIGGYGYDMVSDSFITNPLLTAVDLNLLHAAILADGDITPAFRYIEDSVFSITGGNAALFDEEVCIFGGHDFGGIYTHPASPLFTQRYTNRFMQFHLNDDGTDMSVSDMTWETDTIAFHRRDGNLAPVIFPDGNSGLVAFGGVFQYEADLPWQEPVFVHPDSIYTDTSFHQKFNSYTCPLIPMYKNSTQQYFAILFGGIAQFYYDAINDTIKEDLNVPFVKDISAIVMQADGEMQQIVLPIQMDGLLGSNAVFVPNDALMAYDNGVLDLDAMAADVLLGYIYGGIDAEFANFTPSIASNRLFAVWLHRNDLLQVPQSDAGYVSVMPNPFGEKFELLNRGDQPITEYAIYALSGEEVLRKNIFISPGNFLSVYCSGLPGGMYILKVWSGDNSCATRLFHMQ